MSLRDDIVKVEKKAESLEQSLATEIIMDSKKANKRICVSFTAVIIGLVIGYFATVAMFLNYIKNIGSEEINTIEKTQEIHDVESIDSSYIINGDNYGNN
jgi:hypothetical protein